MVKLVAFKRQVGDGHYFDDLIYHYQRFRKLPDPNHVHAELDFGETMFSASGRGKNGISLGEGTRFTKSIRDFGKWDEYPLLITPEKEVELYEACKAIIGKKYDWLGILGMALPFNIQLGRAWYCSEIVHNRLAKVGIIEPKAKIMPGEMLKIYRDSGLIKSK